MLPKKHVLTVFLLGVVVMSGFAPALGTTSDISSNAVAPLVVQFGDSIEELAALAELKANFPQADVVDFRSQSQILSFAGPIIYIGHGSEEGIRYYGRTVPWEFLANLIRNSASDAHYILGCESSKVTELTLQTGKRVFSFEQKVDAIFGLYLIISKILPLGNNNLKIIINKMYKRLYDLLVNGATPRFLYPTESGYQVAIRKQYMSHKIGFLTTYAENILWINGANWVLNGLIYAIGTGGGLAFKTIVDIFVLTLGIAEIVAKGLASAILVAIGVLLYWHSGQRYHGDLMLGIGAQILPVPLLKIWLNNDGPQKVGDNTKYWTYITGIDPTMTFFSLNKVSSDWIPIIA